VQNTAKYSISQEVFFTRDPHSSPHHHRMPSNEIKAWNRMNESILNANDK